MRRESIKKSVDLSCLPKCGETINWKGSVGNKVPFVYGDKSGTIEIVSFDKGKLILKYLDVIFYNKPIGTNNFKKCKLGYYLNTRNGEFRYEIGEVFKNDKRDYVIIDRKKIKNSRCQYAKHYKYKCLKCGFDCGEHYKGGEYKSEKWVSESTINKGNIGCASCSAKITVPGINDIPTTAPWMVKYFQGGYDEAKRYSRRSMVKIYAICPYCNNVKNKLIPIDTIYSNKSIGCTCGDGFSFPEKFMYSLLKQINLGFETQYSPDYLENKRSDFYICGHSLIVEMDGALGHEGGRVHSKSDMTLDETVQIDNWKDEQHRLHGVDTIRINCFESDMEYIKENILNSKLAELFDLSKVDWLKCEEYALKNIVKEVCDYWNNKEEWEGVKDLQSVFSLSKFAITNYLKNGTRLKWCYYDGECERKKGYDKNNKPFKKIRVFTDDGIIGIFTSKEIIDNSQEILNINKTNKASICRACNNMQNGINGFMLEYVADDEEVA